MRSVVLHTQQGDRTAPDPVQDRRSEVLRQASIALKGRAVTLWEVSSRADVTAVLTSAPAAKPQDTTLDLDRTLPYWGAPIIQSSRWVGCRVDGNGLLWVAPVREQPAAPPPARGGRP